MKKIILITMALLFSGCLTDAGNRNKFEVASRLSAIQIKYVDKTLPNWFVPQEDWRKVIRDNNIEYHDDDKFYEGASAPKDWLSLPQEGVISTEDCDGLMVLAVANYKALDDPEIKHTGYCFMGAGGSNYHWVAIFSVRGKNMAISSTSKKMSGIDSVDGFKKRFDEYEFFNFYNPDCEEISSGDVYEEGLLRVTSQ